MAKASLHYFPEFLKDIALEVIAQIHNNGQNEKSITYGMAILNFTFLLSIGQSGHI